MSVRAARPHVAPTSRNVGGRRHRSDDVALPGVVIRRRTVITGLVAVALTLTLAHYVSLAVAGPDNIAMFDLGEESNLGSWFGSALHLVNAGLLVLIALNADQARAKWWLLSLFVLGASVDESVGLHERLGSYIEDAVHTSGALTFAWVIPGIAFVVVVGLWTGPMLLRTSGGRLVVLGAVVFVVGAVGFEMLEGVWSTAESDEDTGFSALIGVEETLEMLGAIITTAGLLGVIGGLGRGRDAED